MAVKRKKTAAREKKWLRFKGNSKSDESSKTANETSNDGGHITRIGTGQRNPNVIRAADDGQVSDKIFIIYHRLKIQSSILTF